jgi:magnesium chelatase family protein
MLAAVRSAAVTGIDASEVVVEVDVQQALPSWTLVGLPSSEVRESRERVTSALANSGFALPPRRVTVNLAPADLPKAGTAYDLPIALALLAATQQLDGDVLGAIIAVGELGLDGRVRTIPGVLPVARFAATRSGVLVVPAGNLAEAALVGALACGDRLAGAVALVDLVEALRRGTPASGPIARGAVRAAHGAGEAGVDFADVVGQEGAKRAMEVAAAGGHNLSIVGPPGAGKTMLARRLPTILPALSEAEALEVIAVHSVAGLLTPEMALPPPRPFRAPHHTVSTAGLIGGGSNPRPGEVSLAHLGVLFLDELLEFPRHALEALRQPLEDGVVTITRVARAVTYPARCTLVAAANPCPCGRAGDGTTACTCIAAAVRRYQLRLSGPLSDRIDMHVVVPAVPIERLAGGSRESGDDSATMRARIEAARARQRARYRELAGVTTNAQAGGRWLAQSTPVDADARARLATVAERLSLSARAYHRVLKVARTIADLEGARAVTQAAVDEALQYRPRVTE